MDRYGVIKTGEQYYSYQIGETPLMSSDIIGNRVAGTSDDASEIVSALPVSGYNVWPAGVDNLAPNVVKNMIGGNRLLPELIEKQVRFLYGNGPMLYVDNIAPDGTISRSYVHDKEIEDWLDSWCERGLPDDFNTYINKAIRSFYYSEGIYSKWKLTRGREAGMNVRPVAGLEHIDELRCRFCTKKSLTGRTDVEDRELDYVMVGNWEIPNLTEFKVYPRFKKSEPLSRDSAISYSKNPSYGEAVYSTNVFFKGIKSWIRGSNATPDYINSFLENALSARLHVIIPNKWYEEHEQWLKDLCDKSEQAVAKGKPKPRIKVADKYEIEIPTVYDKSLIDRYTSLTLKNFTEFLSGRGKNQGKIYASKGYVNELGQPETWKIEEIPQKFKEYIEAVISYDKRTDMVLLSARGLDSSISNVSADGVISKSGSDAYYNYLIYLSQQAIPERVVCADVNYAIRLNFPEQYRNGIRLGFYRPVIHRQEETTPSQRIENSI